MISARSSVAPRTNRSRVGTIHPVYSPKSVLCVTGFAATSTVVTLASEGSGTLSAMAGTWTRPGPKPFEHLSGADLTVAPGPGGQPRVRLTFYQFRDADGFRQPDEWSVVRQSLSGETLSFRMRRKGFDGAGQQEFETDWEFRLVGQDQATLRETWSSRKKGASEHGERPQPAWRLTRAR